MTDDFSGRLAEAHRQLLERDQRIDDLMRENIALRARLDAIFATRSWRVARRFRFLRHRLLRRS
jgi:hypothetical protein